MPKFDPDRFNEPARSLITGEILPRSRTRSDGTTRARRAPGPDKQAERLRAFRDHLEDLERDRDYWLRPHFSGRSAYSAAKVDALENSIAATQAAIRQLTESHEVY